MVVPTTTLSSTPHKKTSKRSGHQELALTERGAPSARRMGGTGIALDSARSNNNEDDDDEDGVGYARQGGRGEEWWEDYEFSGK